MKSENFNLQDRPPVPVMTIKNVDDFLIKKICSRFALSSSLQSDGYLLQTQSIKSNYKIAFLDLFFASLYAYKNEPKSLFFILEKNIMREELETYIFGAPRPETTAEFQISQWHKMGKSCAVSGFAQATLFQAQFLPNITSEILVLEDTQIMNMIHMISQQPYRRSA